MKDRLLKAFLFIFLKFYSSFDMAASSNANDITKIRHQMFDNYDKYVIPIANDTPIDVRMYMYINDMVPLDNTAMHFSVDVFLRLFWKDYRLAFNHSDIETIPFDYQMMSLLWIPNIYFIQSKAGFKHSLLQYNALANIDKHGNVVTSERISLNSYCDMKMKFYPFDIQKCRLDIESYAFNTKYLNLTWDEPKGVDSPDNLKTTDFSQVKFLYSSTTQDYGKLGDYSRLTIEFDLFRNLALYILRDFFPCMLIVCLSWVAFWISYKVTPARVAFAITTVLTVVTLTNNVKANSPESSTFRSIDYYLLFCQLFVFGALAECALIGMANPSASSRWKKGESKAKMSPQYVKSKITSIFVKSRKSSNKVEDIPEVTNAQQSNDRNGGVEGQPNNDEVKPSGWRIGPVQFDTGDAHIVDRISRIVFPVLFLLMNIVYFAFHRLHPDTVD